MDQALHAFLAWQPRLPDVRHQARSVSFEGDSLAHVNGTNTEAIVNFDCVLCRFSGNLAPVAFPGGGCRQPSLILPGTNERGKATPP